MAEKIEILFNHINTAKLIYTASECRLLDIYCKYKELGELRNRHILQSGGWKLHRSGLGAVTAACGAVLTSRILVRWRKAKGRCWSISWNAATTLMTSPVYSSRSMRAKEIHTVHAPFSSCCTGAAECLICGLLCSTESLKKEHVMCVSP